MARIRLPLALVGNGVGIALPTYSMVPDSFTPVTPGKVDSNGILHGVALADPILAQVTALVDVPDEDTTNGQVDNAKIRGRYPNHPLVTAGHFV